MAWGREHEYVVCSHDLDFETLLTFTQACSPSVLQIRTWDVLPASIGTLVHAPSMSTAFCSSGVRC